MYAGSAAGPIMVEDVMSAAGVLSDMTAGRWLDDDRRLGVVTEGKQGVARVWQRPDSPHSRSSDAVDFATRKRCWYKGNY
jgi:hypothetical protein